MCVCVCVCVSMCVCVRSQVAKYPSVYEEVAADEAAEKKAAEALHPVPVCVCVCVCVYG